MLPTNKSFTSRGHYNIDKGATGKNEISYMISNNNEVSFHVVVGDIEAIQGIPFNRNAWHCGDGNGTGNRKIETT